MSEDEDVVREYLSLGDVPALLVYCHSLETAAAKGCILVLHGLGASKDVQLPDLENLAKRGFLALGIDNVGHGERLYADFDTRFSQASPHYAEAFSHALMATAREIPLIVDELERMSFVREGRLGVLGISMGAFITYTALTLEPRLKAAVAIVGSPEWLLDLPESPHRQLARFDRVRLLSQTAGQDEVVPSSHARAFHARLKERYGNYDERFAYIEYPRADHLLEEVWDQCWANTLAWFDKHLV